MRTASNLLLPVSAETPKKLTKSISAEGQGQSSFADDLQQAKVDLDAKEGSKTSPSTTESEAFANKSKSESTTLTPASSTSKDILSATHAEDPQTITDKPTKSLNAQVDGQVSTASSSKSVSLGESEGILVPMDDLAKSTDKAVLSEGDSGNKLQSAGTMAPPSEESVAVLSGSPMARVTTLNTNPDALAEEGLASAPTQKLSPEDATEEPESSISVTQSLAAAAGSTKLGDDLSELESSAVSEQADSAEQAVLPGQAAKAKPQTLHQDSLHQSSFPEMSPAGTKDFQQTPLAEQIDLANSSSQNESVVLATKAVEGTQDAGALVTDVDGDKSTTALLASSAGVMAEVKRQVDEGTKADGIPVPKSVAKNSSIKVTQDSSTSLLTDQDIPSKAVEAVSLTSLDSVKKGDDIAVSAVDSSIGLTAEADKALVTEADQVDTDNKQPNSIALSQALLASTMKANKAVDKSEAEDTIEKAVLSANDSEVLTGDALSTEPLDDGVSWVMSQMQASQARPNSTKSNSLDNDGVPLTVNVVEKSTLESASAKTVLAAGASTLLGEGSSEAASVDSTEFEVETEGMLEEFVAKEPIELRKKEQDALITRMSSTVERAANDAGGLGSSLQTGQMAKAAPAALAAGVNTTGTTAQNLAMNLPPQHPGWAGEMTQKVAWVARDGGQTAHIRLDPPELGSLTVKISVDKDAATQVSFVAATPQARDMIEGQMHRLREMLAQQGMELNQVNVDVSQQDASSGQFADAQDQQNNSGTSSTGLLDDADMALAAENVSYVSATGVDYYA